jgi:tetratricopeptide (TPR) repeat protein
MKTTLEEAVPYHRSVLWQIHDAYFATRGLDAWVGGDIPYLSTSNFAAARQHARLFEALVAELESRGALAPDAPLPILEIGSGLGELAGNYLRALDERIAPRVRYVISDYHASTVTGAIDVPEMQARVAAGQVIPALFDLRDPTSLRDLDGRELRLPLIAVLASYVGCVAPIKVVRRDHDRYFEVCTTIAALEPLEDVLMRAARPGVMRALDIRYSWREAPLEDIAGERFHAAVLARMTAAHPQAVVQYPFVLFDLLRALRDRLADGGMIVLSDYGRSEGGLLHETTFRGPEMFGNSLAHGLDFAIFEHFAAVAGASTGRTQGALRSVQTAVLRFGGMSAAFAEAFARHQQASSDSDAVLDLTSAARHFSGGPEAQPIRAVRLFQRALELDPYSAALHHEIADACLQAGLLGMAEAYLHRCVELDQRDEHDVDFDLGRVYARTDRPREALACYQRSLERGANPGTLANMAVAYMELGSPGELDAAEAALLDALEIAPGYERAGQLLAELRARRPPKP